MRIHKPETIVAVPAVFDRLQTLGDETRSRLLLLLDGHELTVSELCAVVQLPQSTVSRHLKVLSDDGWVRSRADGPSRHYRMADLDAAAGELWAVVRQAASGSRQAIEDRERARAVRAERRERSRAFFASAAGDWDRLRAELFGGGADRLALFGLLDADWTVADLGAGTGALTSSVCPFVRRVHAVDSSSEMLASLERRLEGAANVDVHEAELESLPLADASVDVAFMVLVLHHIVEPGEVLREANRVLRPGGRLIVVDMREHDREEYRARMGHVWTGFSASVLTQWSERAGFADAVVRPLPPDISAKGPPLFVATLRKPAVR